MKKPAFRKSPILILFVITGEVVGLGTYAIHPRGDVNRRLEGLTSAIYRRLEIASELREAADTRARMQQSVSGIVLDVRSASNAIADASRDIAAGTPELQDRPREQASDVQRTVTSTSRMDAPIQVAAQSSRSVSQVAEQAMIKL